MSLAPPTRLGPYEIVSRLGAGAMGEVYRARDSRLGRDVAIKILPAGVSSDPGRRARFEQEARAVAALNHPNILGLYDIGNEEGVFYIVTEFVAGETLAALLERGPLPVRKLLDIAVQIADGMAAAHAARITHRDLKPLNIMVGADGRVKILDFGLAKQTILSADPDETVAATHTQPGMIMGTVNYMSPEQARGAPTDYRSDQFSFGLILYEMAAGSRAFDRPESVQTMSAIIGEDAPPIGQNIPAPLRWTIDRCLAKDPAERYESSRDLFQGLRSLRDHASEGSGMRMAAVAPPVASLVGNAAPSAGRRLPWPLLAAAFALGLLAACAIQFLRAGPAMPDQSAYRFTPFSFAPGGQFRPVWSPDGKSVAYAASGAEGPLSLIHIYAAMDDRRGDGRGTEGGLGGGRRSPGRIRPGGASLGVPARLYAGGRQSPHLRETCAGHRGVGTGGGLAERPQCVGTAARQSPPGDTGTPFDPARRWGETDSRRPFGRPCDRARIRPVLDRRRFCAIRRFATGESIEPIVRLLGGDRRPQWLRECCRSLRRAFRRGRT